ncbi:hypothetical protein [Planctopirus hydrillae]|uniref:Uncharacterized protein n=1 Tax=Planctopirus hydrillae TaxID=1841610 RepID=A0A1C3E815_9PLAN|nr:hypothetical protein [Planctopirus hydrillae]ODA29373.1 hypothetical protein A6X21_08735 [Planctopirus hydrillae]
MQKNIAYRTWHRSVVELWPRHEWLWPIFMTGIALLISGGCHLTMGVITGDDWSGPTSFRKPALFGISTGLTCISMSWVWGKLRIWSLDPVVVWLTSLALALEVTLITIQFWRGVPSHFNHATYRDAFIEVAMLVLIIIASLGISWLVFRSLLPGAFLTIEETHDPSRIPSTSMKSAIRAGLLLLWISLLLGFIISSIGWAEIQAGRNPELVPHAGVLKFPHGACLHAIQTLPLAVFVWQFLKCGHVLLRTNLLASAHFTFLNYACWQTFSGLARFEPAMGGMILLGLTSLCLLSALCPSRWIDAVLPTKRLSERGS